VTAEVAAGLAARIGEGMRGVALGDALGGPWEDVPPGAVDVARVRDLPARPGWTRGATSDDTAQMLLLARALAEAPGDEPRRFLALLDAAWPLPGAGPTSARAIARYRANGALRAIGGATNGAAMRALPVGWATAAGDAAGRLRLGLPLARTTHAAPRAVVAAVAVAALASRALERPLGEALAGALEEAHAAARGVHLRDEALLPVRDAAAGRWDPPAAGVPLDALTTLAAVLHVLASVPAGGGATAGDAALVRAIALGGDTDTTAAIVGGVLASAGLLAAGGWGDRVALPAPEVIAPLAEALARRRARG